MTGVPHTAGLSTVKEKTLTGIESMTTWTLGGWSVHWAIRTHDFFLCPTLVSCRSIHPSLSGLWWSLKCHYYWSTCRWLIPWFSRVAGQDHEADGNFQQQVSIFDNPTLSIHVSMLRFVITMEFQGSLYWKGGEIGFWMYKERLSHLFSQPG